MELSLLTIVSLQLLISSFFLYLYIRNTATNKKLTEQFHNDSISKLQEVKNVLIEILTKRLDEIKDSIAHNVNSLTAQYEIKSNEVITNIIAEFSELKNDNQQFKVSTTDTQAVIIKRIMDEFSELKNDNQQFKVSTTDTQAVIIKRIMDEFSELKNDHRHFKNKIEETHELAISNIRKELQNILHEIKAPLDLD